MNGVWTVRQAHYRLSMPARAAPAGEHGARRRDINDVVDGGVAGATPALSAPPRDAAASRAT